MKGKDKKALHSRTKLELSALLKEKRSQLIKAKMEQSINKIKDVHIRLKLRREIAIIETVLREKRGENG